MDDDEFNFDPDNLDPSFLITDDTDQHYLESLPELQHEAILRECFDKLKSSVGMSRALKEAARLVIGLELSHNLEGAMIAGLEKVADSQEESKVSEVQGSVSLVRRMKGA
jgi:hypothetical protein